MPFDFTQEAVRDEDGLLMAGRHMVSIVNGDFPEARYGNYLAYQNYGPSTPQIMLFHGKKEETIFYGVEIEYSEMGYSDRLRKFAELRKVRRIENTIFSARGDGSLNNGVEWVTNPISKSFYDKYGKQWMKNLVEDCNTCGATDDHAGIHVHVTRTPETDKAITLIRQEILDNASLWRGISGRYSFSYCNFDINYTSHYNFFGTSGHHPTYECRIFKATTDKELFAARVGTVFMLMDWALNFASISFVEYLREQLEGGEFIESALLCKKEYTHKLELPALEYKASLGATEANAFIEKIKQYSKISLDKATANFLELYKYSTEEGIFKLITNK